MQSDSAVIDEIERVHEDNKDHLQRLSEQLRTSFKVIPFVGAGLSMPFGLPGWTGFLRAQAAKAGAAEQIEARLKADEYEEAADDLLNAQKHRAFHDAIEWTFGAVALAGKKLEGAVSLLPRLCDRDGPVVTTNFDHVLEKVFATAKQAFTRVAWGAQADAAVRAFHENRQYLLKIHGDAGELTGRILTHADYQTHYGGADTVLFDRSLPLPNLLEWLFLNRPVLFLGCGLNRDRTLAILQQVATDHPALAHYAIVEQSPTTTEQQARARFLSKLGIRPIWYPTKRHDLIEPLLAYLAAQSGAQAHVATPARQTQAGNNRLLTGPDDPLLNHRTGFLGREREVAEVVQFLAGDGALAAVTPARELHNIKGAPGIGKTEVCKEALRRHLHVHRNQQVRYVELVDARDATGLLARLAEAFDLSQDLGKEAILAAVSAAPGIIYLDNLEDVLADDEVRTLLASLARGPGVRLLASSRETLPGLARNIDIHRLGPDDATRLFLQEWERSNGKALPDSPEAREFTRQDLDCHPLSIVLAAAQAYQYDAFSALRGAWRAEAMRLAQLPRDPGDRLSSLQVSLSISFHAARREFVEAPLLWGLMALFPEGFSAAARDRVFEGKPELASRLRAVFRRLNLIEVDEQDTFSMLAPLRQFILDKATNNEDGLARQALAETAYAYFARVASEAAEHQWDERHSTTLDALLAEFANIHHFVLFAASLDNDWPQKLSRLSSSLLNFYQFRSLLGEEILRRLLPLQQVAGLTLAVAQSSKYLGDLERHLGKLDEAQAHYTQAIALYQQERDNLGLANAYQSVGDLLRARGEFTKARSYYLDARLLYIEERDNMGLGYTCSELARVAHALGDMSARATFLHDALEAARTSNVQGVVDYVLAVQRELSATS